MKKILGIAAYYHDSAAALIEGENIIAAAQEERFSRVKHDPAFPKKAIQFCLEQGQCKLEELDAVVFYDKPMLKFERLLETYLAHAPFGLRSFFRAMPVWLKEKLFLKSILKKELQALCSNTKEPTKLPQLLFTQHHQAHAASAFYPSPFEEAAVLCLDGVGEWATTTIWHGKKNQLTPLMEINFPHSLGLLYSAFTYYCGFKVNSGEYKLMGLAPYGTPKYVDTIYQHLISVKSDGSFQLNMKYFDYPVGSVMTSKAFNSLFGGPPRQSESELTQKEMDLAASIQQVIEEVVLKIAAFAQQETGSQYLCLAGGVALNCVANGRLLREGPFQSIWVQPASGDAGGSIGAAMTAAYQYFNLQKTSAQSADKDKLAAPADKMKGAYLGPEYSTSDIQTLLQKEEIPFQQFNEEQLNKTTANLIANGKVIGWFQGKMEFGPRALGNRSILGDPRNTAMQSIMNLKIKQRESFRPFAPAVLAEDAQLYFEQSHSSPYMLLVSHINKALRLKPEEKDIGHQEINQARSNLPAITHLDYSARVQTVHQSLNPKFYNLLKAFKDVSGVGVLINTSFNVRGEPPVCSPKDALTCFLATEMDYLVLNDVLIDKAKINAEQIVQAKQQKFELD
ncbi:carbamoyltransferase family protein [Pleionea sediminis]|uniref:carbamoyltransferase family protein n=1 Tax=Pleionea sediminis TaxID=2569479 RepID=UPI001185488B|nr:carbamoyltransferase [Pleionea sediminis]